MKTQDEYQKIIKELWAILGPKVPECVTCRGCKEEWSMALKVLERATKE